MRRLVVCFALLLALPSIIIAMDQPPARIRILLVDGFSNHNWRYNTGLLLGLLQPTGLFAIDVSTAPPTAAAPGWDTWRPKFKDYDVVLQTCNDINGGPSWPKEVQTALEDYIAAGGGMFDYHAANNAFPAWPAYNEMIGLGWRKKEFGWAISIDANEKLVRIPAGEGLGTGHGPQADTVITNLGEHPIHTGLPKKWKTPHLEVYYYARGPAKNLEVLSYGYDAKTQMNWPTEWIVTSGRGRIYNATFGHVWKDDVQPPALRCAGVQTIMIRALQWLARRPVTYPVPADFPTESTLSIRPEIPTSVPPVPPPDPPKSG